MECTSDGLCAVPNLKARTVTCRPCHFHVCKSISIWTGAELWDRLALDVPAIEQLAVVFYAYIL